MITMLLSLVCGFGTSCLVPMLRDSNKIGKSLIAVALIVMWGSFLAVEKMM